MPLPLALLAAAPGIIEGGVKIGQSLIGRKDRMAEQDLAKKNFSSQDFSNVYANMENPFEDLMVNTGAADFQRNTQTQNLADIMGSGKAAAGSGGIGAFSQMLANQASKNSQAISADLGMQESNIANRQAEGALSIDQMQRQGELTSMGMRNEQLGTIFGIDQAELAGSEAAIAQARAARTGMAGEIVGGVASNPNLFA